MSNVVVKFGKSRFLGYNIGSKELRIIEPILAPRLGKLIRLKADNFLSLYVANKIL